MTLEAQINAIESANINMETLQAMEAAGKAMEAIHHNLTPQKVDETMYVILYIASIPGAPLTLFFSSSRDKLRDQNDLSNEVMAAITSNPLGQEIDESELDAELEELQQEKISEQMLATGPVPTTGSAHRLPKVSNRQRAYYDRFLPACETKFEKCTDVEVNHLAKKAAAVQDDEEEELRRLEAEMAI